MAKYTTKQIIRQFKDKHGDLFDYSLVDYVGTSTKVTIICRKHGAFDQLAGAHKRGQGCAKCMYDGKRKSLDEALQKFRSVHGDRYDYSLVKYKNIDAKVRIVCAEHGVFLQAPYYHALGSGCPKCIGRHKTQEEVIELFKLAHGDRYDYSQVVFVRTNGKVDIICREHGVFSQSVTNHMSGNGCPKCAGIYQYTTSEIVEKFKSIHGDTYNYNLVSYEGNGEKVKIVCLEHGVFEQVVYSHLSGSGCPTCYIPIGHSKSSYVNYCDQHDGTACLYVICCHSDITKEVFFKVGISRLGANFRFPSQAKLPYSYEVVSQVFSDAGSIWDLEKSIHSQLSLFSYIPIINFSGKTECFTQITSDIMGMIDSHSVIDCS